MHRHQGALVSQPRKKTDETVLSIVNIVVELGYDIGTNYRQLTFTAFGLPSFPSTTVKETLSPA
eukprot:m.453998 g.453998  ORF g.453998 m.453998 type:complete len:64 (+) comp20592_c0_seq1:79-270(+)